MVNKWPHLGGNLYCEHLGGIHMHRYGVHIFHTNNRWVWDFVNSIIEFNHYTSSPVINYRGQLYSLPFNMDTSCRVWGATTPAGAQAKLDEQRIEAVAKMKAEGINEPRGLEEQALVLVGCNIYERLIKGYTKKQWGRKCTRLPAFIIKRLPMRLVFGNNYFNNRYQGIPVGEYNKLIGGLLDGVKTQVNANFSVDQNRWEDIAGKIIYTGKIDEYFDYALGNLEHRTVCSETRVLNTASYQGNTVVNYAEAEEPYTRIVKHKHFEMFGPDVDKNPKTVISCEYPTGWTPGMESYYPMNDSRNSGLYARYKALAGKGENMIFGGHLAEYKYYDMAPIVDKMLNMFN